MPEDFASFAKQFGGEPVSVEDSVVAAARRHGVDEHLARAVAANESSFNPAAVGPAVNGQNARGVMQLMPGTAKDMGVTDPMDADQSIEGGVKYLGQLQKKYGNDWTKVAQAYHAGPGNVDKGIIGPATNDYVAKVLKSRETYAGGGGGDFASFAKQFGGTPVEPPAGAMKTAPAPGGQTSYIKPEKSRTPTEQANAALPSGLSVTPPKGPQLPEEMRPDNPNAYMPSGLRWALPPGKEIAQGVAQMSDPNMERKAQGLHQVVSGAAQLEAPTILAGAGAPVRTAIQLGKMAAAQQGVTRGGEAAGVPEGYRNLAGDAAAGLFLPRRTPRPLETPPPGGPPSEPTFGDKVAEVGKGWLAKAGRREVRKIPGGDFVVGLYDRLTQKPKPTPTPKATVQKPPPEPKPASAREVATRDILQRANVDKAALAKDVKNPQLYSDVPPDPFARTTDPRALDPEYIPPEKPQPTATSREAEAMNRVLTRQEGVATTQKPNTEYEPTQRPQAGTSTEDFTAPDYVKPEKVVPYKGFEPKGKYNFTPGDNPYGAPGRPTMRGEFVPPKPEAPVVEKPVDYRHKKGSGKNMPKSGGLEDQYGGQSYRRTPTVREYNPKPLVEETKAATTTDKKGGGGTGAAATPPGGPPPPPAAQTRKPTGPPPPPVQTPRGTAPGKKLTRAQMAAAKKLKQSLGGDKSDEVLHIEPPERQRDYASENRDKVVTDYLEASGQQRGITPEVYQKASPEEQAAIEASVRAMPSSHRNRGGYSDTSKQAIIDALKGLKHGGVIKPMALGGVIQTISAQKPQIRRSRRGIAYGPPHLLKGKNPPPVPLRSKI